MDALEDMKVAGVQGRDTQERLNWRKSNSGTIPVAASYRNQVKKNSRVAAKIKGFLLNALTFRRFTPSSEERRLTRHASEKKVPR